MTKAEDPPMPDTPGAGPIVSAAAQERDEVPGQSDISGAAAAASAIEEMSAGTVKLSVKSYRQDIISNTMSSVCTH